ncbi:carbohydrate-binding protein SusD [Niastella yeongjuensis]|uniref:Carbohydrate-binding protein SusD n=1 Tax=Niastella yeongjuensis TaxID=354355 RepID=A0A1V9ES71_9BACT|nr:RagB/SusD family nutrient uptake outer membrane protein [Niastella yeongjuensis]OQP48989.1 carbohydrate-binding protein SusD [Niastella yeongjuensis]SEP09751.1 Starch-binding associating with outer membrane [Niastella yeongjuensis]
MNKLLLTIIGCSLLLLTTSCDKLLESKSESVITEADYFQSENDFEPYVTGIYMFIRGSARTGPQNITGIANNITYGTERSEELVSALNARFSQAWTQNITPTTGAFDYATWYKAIGNCNLLLSKIENFKFTNEATKKRVVAEACCLRAYFYFSLIRIIGDAPLMLESISSENVPQLPRSPAKEVMTQIIADLDQAISQFPDKTITSKYRFSYPAAQALKADAKLWSAKVLEGGSADFNDAITALAEVEKAGLTLRNDFGQITTTRANSEVLLSAYFNRDESFANYGLNALPYQTGITGASNIDSIPFCVTTTNGQGAYQISPKSKALFASGDKRIPYTWITERQGTTLKISWITKLPGNKYFDDRVSDNDVIVYRLAEIYLMEAEAYAGISNTTKAIEYLNKTRNRAGIGDYTGGTDKLSVEKEILNERGREFFFENKRWFDLVRFHKGGTIDVYTYVPNLVGKTTPLFWPLAANVLANNGQLRQTDGY